MQRLVCNTNILSCAATNTIYTKMWLNYVSEFLVLFCAFKKKPTPPRSHSYKCLLFVQAALLRNQEDTYEYILHHKIGLHLCSTFVTVADYFERCKKDFRKADKVYRMGLSDRETADALPGKEAARLKVKYEQFEARVSRDLHKCESQLQQVKTMKKRPFATVQSIADKNETYLSRQKRQSFRHD